MPSFAYGKGKSGKHGSVMPSDDQYLTQNKSHLSTASRARPARGWIWIFIGINLVAIVSFIFGSAMYFPPPTTVESIVEQSLKQSEALSLMKRKARDAAEATATVTPTQQTTPFAATSPSSSPQRYERVMASPKTTRSAVPQPTAADLRHNKPYSDTKVSSTVQQSTQEAQAEATATKQETTAPNSVARSPYLVGHAANNDPVRMNSKPASLLTTDSNQSPLAARDATGQAEPPSPAANWADTIETAKPSKPTSPVETAPVAPSTLPPEVASLLAQMNAPPLTQALETKVLTTDSPPTEHASPVASATAAARAQRQMPAPELEVLSSLFLWLKADAGVDLVNEAACDPLRDSTSGCEVIAWKSHTGTGKSVIFRPGSDSKRPIFVPGNDQSGLPSIYFSCPIVSHELQLQELMTLFFVISPMSVEVGDTYVGQKFFGNAPYGQFLLHGGRPSFFTSSGLIETSEMINNGEFALLTYRLHKRQVEIKINGKGWDVNDDAVAVRMSGNSALSVGNVKDMCDTNAFQGRIAEIVVYDTVLSDVQISLVESYLRKKWWNNVMEPLAAPVPEQPVAANSQQIDDKSPEPTKPSMPSPSMNLNQVPERIIFDPDDVFEWVPDESVFRTEEQRAMASSLTARWKKEVADRITTIKNMEIGGDFLRKFIRERKEELIQLRDAMFG